MWDDRFLFVMAALIAMAIILEPRMARLRRTVRFGRRNLKVGSTIIFAIALLLIAVVGSHIWYHWHQSFLPNVTSLISLLLGAVFGAFTAHFVSSLFGVRFGRRDPIIGVSVLLLLSVAYSLPLYSRSISDMLSGIGLSSVKTPFLELTVRERGSKPVTAVASGASFNSGQMPRTSDPIPGLNWLSIDTAFDADSKSDSTLPSDENYISYFDSEVFHSREHEEDVEQVKRFLIPAKILSQCLQKYVEVLPDSGLLLVDVKPVIESMFMLHTRSKRDSGKNPPPKEVSYSSYGESLFWREVNNVLNRVNEKFDENRHPEVNWPAKLDQCKAQESKDLTPFKVDHRQPYGALVLADLIHAHGSPDEAIEVLAEWLNLSNSYQKAYSEDKISTWWQLRVMSRIGILMAEVAGQNNLAYRDFFDAYKKKLEGYFEKRNVTLDRIKTRCKDWSLANSRNRTLATASARADGFGYGSKQDDVAVEQRAFYLLLAAEDESLRTEVNFIGEEGKIERLENLYRRAEFLASVGGECLPENFGERQREGIIADHQVTVGLVGLTVADRMATIGLSRGDRIRSSEIAKNGEKALRAGFATLNSFVEEDRKNIQQSADWQKRVFMQSVWEKSASLAGRAFLRLRTRSD
ncbi:MAG: hypothetical protein ACLPXW_07025 [Xanthobacteraceae bacterium]